MTEPPSSHCGHTLHTSRDLYSILTHHYQPHVETTVVTFIWYGKQKKGARHEFIMIEVENLEARIRNVIVIDRNNPDYPRSWGTGSPIWQQGISGRRYNWRNHAIDTFRVSCNSDERQLLEECQLLNCRYLEEIDFTGSEDLFLYQLVTLVNVVSGASPHYAVVGKNCYWFAGVIWESIRMLRPKARYKGPGAAMRGRLAGLQYTPNRAEVERICNKYKKEIDMVNNRLAALRKNWILNDQRGPGTPHPDATEKSSTYARNKHDGPQTVEPSVL